VEALGAPTTSLRPINRWGGGGLIVRHNISPKDESFPSKERPLLVKLENRRVRERERVVSLWMLVLQLE
jgi:hypothetical protein